MLSLNYFHLKTNKTNKTETLNEMSIPLMKPSDSITIKFLSLHLSYLFKFRIKGLIYSMPFLWFYFLDFFLLRLSESFNYYLATKRQATIFMINQIRIEIIKILFVRCVRLRLRPLILY